MWINDEDIIAPDDKDDLLYIAMALNDTYLINNIDEIYDICKFVRNAHVRAGNEISNRLKKGIAIFLSELTHLKREDIWDPIELELDELGKIIILKVLSIGNTLTVDIGNTNRILTGQSGG